MSSKNFMAYGDAETILTGYANEINDRLRYEDNAVLGAKNFLPNKLVSGTESNDVTYSVSADGIVTTSGTASADSFGVISSPSDGLYLDPGTYILSGCPSDGSSSTYYLEALKNVSGTNTVIGDDFGSGATITLLERTLVWVRIVAKSGQVMTGKTFSPMIRLATDTDNTYAPYAMTNKQLTDALSYLEQSVTLSTSGDTTVTFTDSRFTTDSVIDIGVSEWGIVPKSVACTTGVCTVVFGSVDSAHTITCRVYTR